MFPNPMFNVVLSALTPKVTFGTLVGILLSMLGFLVAPQGTFVGKVLILTRGDIALNGFPYSVLYPKMSIQI